MNPEQSEQPENIHAAVDPEGCFKMRDRYGWELRGWRLTGDKILKVDCVFEGEQTSFEDERYEGQDLDRLQS